MLYLRMNTQVYLFFLFRFLNFKVEGLPITPPLSSLEASRGVAASTLIKLVYMCIIHNIEIYRFNIPPLTIYNTFIILEALSVRQ